VKTWVIDANVAVKWVLPPSHEQLVGHALALLDRHRAGEIHFVVPDLFWAEVGNVLWKAARQGRCSTESAAGGLAALKGRQLVTVPSQGLVEAAFNIAATFHRTVYDSLYVALAIETRTQMITADEKLANALAGHCPVQWLGVVNIGG
jgi:predicted nucleic acid-binding protein